MSLTSKKPLRSQTRTQANLDEVVKNQYFTSNQGLTSQQSTDLTIKLKNSAMEDNTSSSKQIKFMVKQTSYGKVITKCVSGAASSSSAHTKQHKITNPVLREKSRDYQHKQIQESVLALKQ